MFACVIIYTFGNISFAITLKRDVIISHSIDLVLEYLVVLTITNVEPLFIV